MDLSGVIFVVLAVAWAVYLIPKALKHHDEVARTRSIDRFSTAMRVLARREPVSRRDARLVVAPGRAADNPRVVVPNPRPAPAARPVNRAAARAAARRRRRILGFLMLSTLVVTGLAAFALVPWWSVAIPAGLTVLYLVLCRTQVRRERDATWDADLVASMAGLEDVEPTRRAAVRVDASYGVARPAVLNEQGFAEVGGEEDTVAIDVAVLDAVLVPTADGGSLWDPLPVTLPTYVSKPKARRTVRTIDLNEPGTWTSGRSEEDSRLVAESAPAEAVPAGDGEGFEEQQRAVGS
ncbi:MAG TPA: hypothetical protein VFV40_08650 [Nocardioides sp.]|nr:hypothetical protein [Nocardioides sp.]